jgi:hypothetical protein
MTGNEGEGERARHPYGTRWASDGKGATWTAAGTLCLRGGCAQFHVHPQDPREATMLALSGTYGPWDSEVASEE